MEVSTNFHGSRWMQAHFHGKLVEVDLLPWKLVEVDLLPRKLVEASMETDGSFHCRWKRKLPLFPSITASTNIFRGSFHELPYTPTYFHPLSRVS